MKFPPFLVGALAGLTALSAVWGGVAHAEPAQDSASKFSELSKQAVQLTEAVQTAQSDFNRKLQLQNEAEAKHAADLAALEAARAELAAYQAPVDKLIAAVYMGGRTDGLNAVMTATSPKKLIDQLAIQREMTTEMSGRMQSLQQAGREAQAVEAESARSAADAKAAVDAAAATRADLEGKQSQLQSQVAVLKASYAVLPPALQAALGPGAAIPTVGMGGLVPNARALVAYILTTYPGVQSIGGVRSDPLPDHPSGHAIDIMIGSDMALGDAINADVQGQSGRFGVNYTMWRVANHYNHVHVTVS